jgi:glycosyltransferase involved in cell wall biosynthesis
MEEIRGKYKSISTCVPGLQVTELLPNVAKIMDKVALVRGGSHENDHHETATNWVLSGRFGSAFGDHPAIGARNLQTAGATLLFAENNLRKNSRFYQKHFGKLAADFWCLPFIAAKRFTRTTPFIQRANKLIATGSITYKMLDPEFIGFFKTDDLQPMRRQLYEHASKFTAEIDTLISDLNTSRTTGQVKPEPTWLRVLRRLFPFKHQQHGYHRYYKKDIVAVYNSYTMFAVPEELGDLPAIGFVEGMACGCAYFGLDDPMYRDLGMEPGVHYVTYDGTVQGLADKVRFYQQPEQIPQLERIAARGCELVNEKFRAEVVYQAFVDRLQRVVKSESLNA